jgi:uncharacterized protein YjbI with pentapeptide repeats
MATKLNHCKQQIEAIDADLSGSVFNDVNFAGTSITNVNFTGLRVTDANLTGACFEDCRTDGMTINGIALSELLAVYRASQK